MPYREDIPGYMPKKDLEIIEALAGSIKENGLIVEVGSYFGRSSWVWAKSSPPHSTVYCIDPWPHLDSVRGIFDVSLEDFKSYVQDCPNVVPIQGYSPHIPWTEDLLVDLVFIDGNHFSPHVDNDLQFWSRMLKPTGILCGHDFNPLRYPDVCETVIRLAQESGWPLRIFEGSTIWYFEKEKEQFSLSNKRMVSQRLILESMSWQPTLAQLDVVRRIYQQKQA
ncbi:hypothetical protein PHSC3_001480 [Chlamydiales bacterium STE3]|nr:hypothetical protein PHSC3_001480 [Chlamydiales bacterium STE3]